MTSLMSTEGTGVGASWELNHKLRLKLESACLRRRLHKGCPRFSRRLWTFCSQELIIKQLEVLREFNFYNGGHM